MSNTTHHAEPRLLTDVEIGRFIRLLREMRQWSQEQLAEIAKVHVRTVQRVENGKGASSVTRRALAVAFDFEDIDALNKPFAIPTQAQAEEQKRKFEQENITLKVETLCDGRQLGRLVEGTMGLQMTEAAELSAQAAASFAQLTDYLTDYVDCHELYYATDKLTVYEELSGILTELADEGFSVVGGLRNMTLKSTQDQPSMPMKVAYLAAFPKGSEPSQFAVSRQVRFG